MSNLILAFGCQPSRGNVPDTKMLDEFFETLRDKYDRRTLSLTFPRELDAMLANPQDAQWELWRSNQLQSVKLFYEHNVVSHSIGGVFVNTYCKSKFHDLTGEERRQQLQELYVPLRMASQSRSEEEARADFENLTEQEYEF